MDIIKLIQQGESETLEFKQSFKEPAIESIGAMANCKGGAVIIGVADNGNVVGIQIGKETLQQWSNDIKQKTEPKLIPTITEYKIEDKTIVQIHIAEYPIKPVSVNGRCYLRSNNGNKQLNAQQISDLHMQSLNLSWDSYEASDRTIDDLDMERVKRYITDVNLNGRRLLNGDPLVMLQKLELVKKGKPTFASYLLFRKNPNGAPFASTRVARFTGKSLVIDDNLIDGSLLDQADEVMKAIIKNIHVRYRITGNIQREEIWDYPLDALREIVINALCHRDYRSTDETQIKIFDDHIFIWNPGGLPHNLSIETLLNNQHVSQPRNRLITQAFYDLGKIERLGSGIQRILDICSEDGLAKPLIEEAMGGFKVTLYMKQTSLTSEPESSYDKKYSEVSYRQLSKLSKDQINALDYVTEHGKITNSDYQMLFKVSRNAATNNLNKLVDLGLLEKTGQGKGTAYILKLYK